MRIYCLALAFACLWAMISCRTASAQIPRTLSYQGVLADPLGNPRPNGFYSFTFRLYSVSSGGGPFWTEVQSLEVKKGLFTAVLGSVTPFPAGLKFNQQDWLGVQVAAEAEMTPRTQLASVASSFDAIRADVAESVPDNTITGAKIAAGQVVRSLNALTDNVVLQGANGASVTADGSTITITASGGGGSGIGSIQNTDNTIGITNPAGPTTTINLKSPLIIPGSLGIGGSPSWPFHLKKSDNTGSGLQARVTNTSTSGTSYASYSLEANNGSAVMQMVCDGLGTGPLGTACGYLGTYTNHPIGLLTNNAERMRITNDGNIAIGLTVPVARLHVHAAGAYGIIGEGVGANGMGVWGNNDDPQSSGVYGTSSGGFGIYGAGGQRGVFGYSANGTGVYGDASQYGVYGIASGSNGAIGVWGQSTANTGLGRGMYGTTQSPDGNGVVGENFATSGAGRGVWGRSNSPNGVGVFGENTNTNGWAAYFVGKTATKTLQILGGSDLAEPFETELPAESIEPGTVMIIDEDHPGKLKPSKSAYDPRVAGIVSGAGGIEPGVTLRQQGVMDGKMVIALAGRVYCKAEASSSPIHPGDLLTTSPLRGHAMKATDEKRSHGSIIGKAMTGLEKGSGLVLVLVSLQ